MAKKNTKKSKPAKSKTTKAAPKKGKAKATKKKAPNPNPQIDKQIGAKSAAKEETMERSALKVIASQLKEMGADIKVLKSDTDEQLQKKVNEQLQKLPTPDVMKKLETVVPEKLVTVLKQDCVGIFIDLADVSCVRCKDAAQCAQKFIQNVKGGFSNLAKAMPDEKVEEKPEKAKVKAATRYEADRLVFVRDVKNPNPVGDSYHDTLQAILDEQPENLGELRAIIERDFDIENDADFMKFVTSLRDPVEGVIKLDVDLSEKNKKELRAAGIDI